MTGSERPERPLLETGIRTGIKDLTKELETLTDTDGPLVLLVKEVKKSNRLLKFALFGVTICLAGIFVVALTVFGVTQSLLKLKQEQVTALESLNGLKAYAKSTDSRVAAAQDALSGAPKIVADASGQLKVVAQIESNTLPISTTTPPDTKPAKKKSFVPAGAKLVSSNQVVSDVPPMPAPAEAMLEPKTVEIPIDMGQIQFK